MSAKNNTHHFPKLLILVGAPGSGKSTFARYFIRTEDNWVRVNRDDFRLMQFGDSLMSPFCNCSFEESYQCDYRCNQ